MVQTRKEEMMNDYNQTMMHATNDGGQAFPQLNSTGMTLRDWFAGQAISGNLEMIGSIVAPYDGRAMEAAKGAYSIADAMIEARKL